MQLSELLPVLHELPREDKVRAAQFLAAELAEEGGLVPGGEYPIWSPYDAVEAAGVLEDYLKEHGGK